MPLYTDEQGRQYSLRGDGTRSYTTPPERMGTHTDERGRPFSYVGGTDRRSYISPVAFGGSKPEGGGGLFRKGWQWDANTGEWVDPFNWDTLASLGVGGLFAVPAIGALAGGAGAGAGAGAGGGSAAGLGGGAAAGSVLPSASIGPLAGVVPGGIGGGAAGLAGGGSTLGSILRAGLPRAGRVLTGMAGQQAQGQRADAAQQLSRDALAMQAAQANADLPGRQLTTGVRASRVANASPVTFDPSTMRFRGGYASPDLVSPEARQLAQNVLRETVRQQQTGSGAIPGPTPAPKAGVGSKILGGAATGLSLLEAVDPFKWF